MTRVGFFSGEDFVCCEPHMRAEKWWCIVVIFLDNVNLNSLLLRLKFNISLYFFVFFFFLETKGQKVYTLSLARMISQPVKVSRI